MSGAWWGWTRSDYRAALGGVSNATTGVLLRSRIDPANVAYMSDEALLALRQLGPARLAEVRAALPRAVPGELIANWVGEGTG